MAITGTFWDTRGIEALFPKPFPRVTRFPHPWLQELKYKDSFWTPYCPECVVLAQDVDDDAVPMANIEQQGRYVPIPFHAGWLRVCSALLDDAWDNAWTWIQNTKWIQWKWCGGYFWNLAITFVTSLCVVQWCSGRVFFGFSACLLPEVWTRWIQRHCGDAFWRVYLGVQGRVFKESIFDSHTCILHSTHNSTVPTTHSHQRIKAFHDEHQFNCAVISTCGGQSLAKCFLCGSQDLIEGHVHGKRSGFCVLMVNVFAHDWTMSRLFYLAF